MADTLVATPETPKLEDRDRCDVKCPAQALVRYKYPDDGHLDFCGHHADIYEVSLLASGCLLMEDRRKKPAGVILPPEGTMI